MSATSPVVMQGALALRVEEYDRDGGGPRPCVQGLRVVETTSGRIAGYRPSSWLYGFLRLPPGPLRLRIEDPSGRYLTRAFGAVAGPPPPLLTTAVRPGPGFPVPPGQLVLWGDVVDDAGEPLPFALLQLRGPGSLRWTSTSDEQGRFLLWPRGLPPRDLEDGEWSFTLVLRARTASGDDPFALLPDDLDAMDDAALVAWFDRAAPPRSLTVPQGARTRVDTLVLTL